MKKFLIAVSFLIIGHFGMAQDFTNMELGARIINKYGSDFAIDATIPIAAKPRLHPTLYIGNGGVGIAPYFDWMFQPTSVEGLKFYPGVGPEFLIFNDFDLGIAGNFGIEYAFPTFPMVIGFDWRPGFIVTNDFDFHTDNFGITCRFNLSQL